MTLQDSQTGPHLVEKRIKLAAHNSEGFQVAKFLLKLPVNNTKNQRGKQSFRVLWPRRSLAPSSREKCRVVQEGMGRRTREGCLRGRLLHPRAERNPPPRTGLFRAAPTLG